MDPHVKRLVGVLHSRSFRCAINVTGGGSQAISWLLGVPGASNTILEACVPYSRSASTEIIKGDKFVSEDAAKDLAKAAYLRAQNLYYADENFCLGSFNHMPILGVGCTAGLVSSEPKRGPHQCFIATHSMEKSSIFHCVLDKGKRDRWEEDGVVSRLILTAVAEAVGIEPTEYELTQELSQEDQLQKMQSRLEHPIDQLFAHHYSQIIRSSTGQWVGDLPLRRAVLMSGSFNPLHEGHQRLAEAAARKTGLDQIVYELAVLNADKPSIPPLTAVSRVNQFEERGLAVAVSSSPLFIQKTELFKHCVFPIGFDTAVRLVDQKYYDNDPITMATALKTMQMNGARFVVAGRLTSSGAFSTLSDVSIPHGFEDMFIKLTEEEFRMDISSTELRAKFSQQHEQ